jgi:hypothetical protein
MIKDWLKAVFLVDAILFFVILGFFDFDLLAAIKTWIAYSVMTLCIGGAMFGSIAIFVRLGWI